MASPSIRTWRRGITLVELLAVMAAGSVLVSVAITAFVAVIRNDRRFAERLDAQQSQTELCDRMRRDVHAATEAAWDEATATLHLASAGGLQVDYAFTPGRCVRREALRDDDEGRLAGVYRLRPRTEWSASVSEAAGHTLVRIGLAAPRPGARAEVNRLQTEVTAVVGRDVELLYP
jgi:prepilin-type N-terminal cleavage/methylation domain-containing protein